MDRTASAIDAASAVRLAVDGPVTADARALADGIASVLTRSGRSVAGVHAEEFLRARSLRLEFGVDAEAYYEGWYDLEALRREVLVPTGPGGTLRLLPRLRDPVTDRPYRERARTVPPGSVVVVDGRFLTRWEVADAFDVLVFLDVSRAAVRRRLPDAEREPVDGAWQRYLDECDPAARAGIVVRFDHPDRPAVVAPG